MRLTRSIRRKLTLSLLILVAMLGVLALTALSGLSAYRSLVRQLEVAVREAPRQSELLASVGKLAEPLGIPIPRPQEPAFERAARRQGQQLQATIDEVRADVVDYFNRLRGFHEAGDAPAFTSGRLPTDGLQTQTRLLEELDRMQREAAGLGRPETRDASVIYIAQRQSAMYRVARDEPDPMVEVLPMLAKAKTGYRTRYWLVSLATGAAAVLLAWLVWLGYRWVYVPVRALHAVARQVAAGRYDARVELTTGDEMSDLAETFNRMADRFEGVLDARDREIHNRSRQLIQSARLADVGFLSAGIAHEVNNPLAAVGMAAEGLEWRLDEVLAFAEAGGMDAAEAKPVREYLTMIQTEAGRVRELTQKMLDFARREPSESEGERNRYDVTAIVREVISMLSHLKRYAAHEVDLPPTGPVHAVIAAGQIKQVVLNVLANALDALNEARPEGGRVEIAVRQTGDRVEVAFTDNGPGMSEHTIEHLFDPFFTTKTGEDGSEKGTGLGLSISHRIATDHGGVLEAESEGPGQGSTFRLRLPKTAEAKRAA